MVYPNGWTVGNSGIATSKKYKGLDAQVMYSGAATDDSAAENEANDGAAVEAAFVAGRRRGIGCNR